MRAGGFSSPALRRRADSAIGAPCARGRSSPASRMDPRSTPTGASPGSDARRARLRLERARGARASHRQPRPARQCDSAARDRRTCQVRFVAGCDWRTFIPAIRTHLDRARLRARCEVRPRTTNRWRPRGSIPTIRGCAGRAASIAATTGAPPAILPNLGGSLPNDCFADVLGLPTIWVPHSYPACSQHAPDEHLLARVAREGLAIMTGLFWDLGEPGSAPRADACDRRRCVTRRATPDFATITLARV